MGDDQDDFLLASLHQHGADDIDDGCGRIACTGREEPSLSDRMQQLQATNDTTLACSILQVTMGNMALCRGKNGKDLYAAGAVEALHSLLLAHAPDRHEVTMLTLGAVRDLACGNADVRNALHRSLPLLYNLLLSTSGDGSTVVEPFNPSTTYSDQDPTSLQLVTAVLSALRNISHSHRPNCTKLHELGLTNYLVKTVLHQPPPVAGLPTRQAYFRASGILLNIVEKCADSIAVVSQVLDHLMLVHHQKVLHPGLLRLLQQLPDHEADDNKYKHLLAFDARKRQTDRERELLRNQEKRKDKSKEPVD